MRAAVLGTIGLLAAGSAGAEWIGGTEAALTTDSNVTRAQRESDIRSDSALLVSISGGQYLQLTDRTGLALTGTLQREEHQHYAGLSHFGLGPSVSVRTKLGVGAMVPWLRVSASALRLEFDDDARSGWLFVVAGATGRRLSERIDVRAQVRLERRIADRSEALVRGISGAVFDLDGASVSVDGDYALTAATLVSAGYSYRVGDVVSSTRRNSAIFGASKAIAADPVFGSDTIAYKLDARSHTIDLRVSHAIGDRMSLNLGLGRSFTYGDGGNDYYGTHVTAAVMYDF